MPDDVVAVAVHLRVAAPHLDVLSGVLWELGVLGVHELEPAEEVEEVAEADEVVDLVVTVADRAAATGLVASLGAPASPAARLGVEVRRVADVGDDGWRDEWRRFAVPVRAGRHLVVVPSWLDPPDDLAPDDVVVRIDPGRAFGSGSHASTRLALAALEAVVGPGDRVLDVGCGSGVLSVVAARLGAAEVVAVDVDPEAVRATAANAVAGGVDDIVGASSATLDEVPGRFDVVVANIGAGVLVELAPVLVGRVRPAGSLVLSGILLERRSEVDRVFGASGCVPVDEQVEDGWVALTLATGAAT